MPRAASNVIVIPKNSMNRAATGRGAGGYARLTYLVAGAYLLLMLIGTLFVSFSESQLTAYVSYLCETRITDRLDNSVALTMLSCVFPQLILILLCSIFANSTAGVPFLLSILLFKGFYSGMLNASVVSLVGIRGLLAAIGVFAPSTVLSAAALIFLVSEGIRTSSSIHHIVAKGKPKNLKPIYDSFYHALAISLILTVASAVLEGLLFQWLGSHLVIP